MTKKPKIDKTVKTLAKEILKDHKQEDTFTSFDDTLHKQDRPIIERIKLPVGLAQNVPFIVKKTEREIYSFLETYFGSKEGDYFILNELTQTKRTKEGLKRIKGILLEDKNNFRYLIWFDTTALSYLSTII